MPHPRFYAPAAQSPADLVALPDDEAQHLTRVLRLRAGADVVIFDGRGHEFDAVVEQAAKSSVQIRVGPAREPRAREAVVAVTLAQAVLKGDKMDDVVRDAVMMGVAAIQPVVTMRSEASLTALERGRRRERWQRVAISSAKQCGRAVVPPVHAAIEFAALASALRERTLPGPGLMLVEPSASADAISLSELDGAGPRETTLLVGPEGGWTAEELAQATPVCRLIVLGSRTLRADAVPVVALSALFTLWKEF